MTNSESRDNDSVMRKRIVGVGAAKLVSESDEGWLNLNELATVEVTSEDGRFPIEAVFSGNGSAGWRAALAGEQVIRIVFDEPAALGRVWLRFDESESDRTQQFILSWCPAEGGCREIVRQQWNFSPSGSTTEIEDYTVHLENVSALELVILPDIRRNNAVAKLTRWRIGGLH